MNRIDEIKERVEVAINERIYHHGNGMVGTDNRAEFVAEFSESSEAEFYINARGDILYLLFKLELAEKALELTIKELDDMWLDDEIGLLQSQINNLNKAKEVLQQIREGE